MLIYFQVVDRTVRGFLNDLMPRLPVAAGAGETPPGITDALIFYDPLVKPTRPGTILPAKLVQLLEEGQRAEAENLLVDLIRDAASAKTVEQDGEIEMLTIEEDEHRTRLRHIEQRRAHLKDMMERLSTATAGLQEWSPSSSEAISNVENANGSEATSSAGIGDAPEATGAKTEGYSAETTFYAQLAARVRGIMERTGGILSAGDFDEGFGMGIDLGISGTAPVAETKGCLRAMREAASSETRRVMCVSDYLAAKFSETYQLAQIKEMEEALSAVRHEWEEVNNRMSRLQKKRMDVLHASGLNLSADLDRLVMAQYRYFILETKRRRLALTVEEKKQYGILSEEIEGIERRIDTDLYLRYQTSSDFMSTFQRLKQATVQSLHELIDVEEGEREKKEILEKLAEPYRRSTPKERILKMEEQIQRLGQFAKLLMGRGRQRPFTPVTPPPWPVKASAVLEVVERIHEMDRTMFSEKFLRRRGGPPAIMLFPCFGSGLYDWRDSLLVISLYPDNLQTAVLSAIAEFRLDADESKDLFNSYSTEIKRNKNMGFVRLKEMFVTDYATWLGKEAAGYRVMEKDVRTWFERKIPLEMRKGTDRGGRGRNG